MPTIELSSEVYRRVEEFTQVVRAVLNEDVDASTSLGIVLERGLQTGLSDIVARQEESVRAIVSSACCEKSRAGVRLRR